MVLLLGAMADDVFQYFRRSRRREYLRRHEKQRRATAKAEGARRIDVTLRGNMLDDFATVRLYLEGLNRAASERNFPGWPVPVSATEIIRLALSCAAEAIREDDDDAAKRGRLRILPAALEERT